MQFVNDLAADSYAGPALVCPLELGGIDYLGRPMRPLGLKARGRIGQFIFAVQAELVEATFGSLFYQSSEIAAPVRLQLHREWGLAALKQDYLNFLSVWRPYAKVRATLRERLCPYWKLPLEPGCVISCFF